MKSMIYSRILKVLLLVFLPSFSYSLDYKEIKDEFVLKSIEIYNDSLNSKVSKIAEYYDHDKKIQIQERVPYHLILRRDSLVGNEFVYIAAVTYISDFWYNLPDSFFEMNGQLIFIYSDRSMEYKPADFESFRSQFKDLIIDDWSEYGRDGEVELRYISLNYIGTFQFKKSEPIRMKEVDGGFPDDGFIISGYTYDLNARLMYLDGVYSVEGLDYYPKMKSKWVSITEKLGLDEKFLIKKSISAILSIDERGMVFDVVLFENQDTISKDLITNIRDVLSRLRYEQGKVLGKKVKYRINIGVY